MLQGVFIDGTVAVATDGRQLVCIPIQRDPEDVDQVIVPVAVFEIACEQYYKNNDEDPEQLVGESRLIRLHPKYVELTDKDDNVIKFDYIGGPYPDWRKTIPTWPKRRTVSLNADKLKRIINSMDDTDHVALYLHPTEPDQHPIFIRKLSSPGSFGIAYGLLMPMRDDA